MFKYQNPGQTVSAIGASSTPTRPAQPHPEISATILGVQELTWEKGTGPSGLAVLRDRVVQKPSPTQLGCILEKFSL
jgi:hypothetical protein